MSSVRYFYFFICLNILFFISLQMNNENSENATNTTAPNLNPETLICTTNPEKVKKEFTNSFNGYSKAAWHSILYRKYGSREHQPVDRNVEKDEVLNQVKYKVQKDLENYINLLSFCKLVWLNCYNKYYRTAKNVSVESIQKAIIENIDEGETSNANRNNEDLQINEMINRLPMFGCTALDGIFKPRFFISIFEKFFKKFERTTLEVFIFENNAKYGKKAKNVKLNAHMSLTYTEEYEKKIQKMKNEIQSELAN